MHLTGGIHVQWGLMEWGAQLWGPCLGSQTCSPCPPSPAAQGSAPGTFSSLLQPQGLCQALSGSAARSRAAPWDQVLFTLAELDPDLLLPLKQTKKPHQKVPNSHGLFLWPSPLKMRGFRGETDPSGHLMEQVCDRLCPPCGPSRAPTSRG